MIRYRRRGYGGSVAHNGPFSLAQQASDALGVLTHFGLDCAHVVGQDRAMTDVGSSLEVEGPALPQKITLVTGAGSGIGRAAATGVPQAEPTMAVEPLMDVRAVADAVVFMAKLPLDANVQFMTSSSRPITSTRSTRSSPPRA